jgi:hypothetical protein
MGSSCARDERVGCRPGVRTRSPVRGAAGADPLADDLPDRDTSDEQKRRAALIAGHLSRDRLRDGAALSERMLLASIAYAGALATPQGNTLLPI